MVERTFVRPSCDDLAWWIFSWVSLEISKRKNLGDLERWPTTTDVEAAVWNRQGRHFLEGRNRGFAPCIQTFVVRAWADAEGRWRGKTAGSDGEIDACAVPEVAIHDVENFHRQQECLRQRMLHSKTDKSCEWNHPVGIGGNSRDRRHWVDRSDPVFLPNRSGAEEGVGLPPSLRTESSSFSCLLVKTEGIFL